MKFKYYLILFNNLLRSQSLINIIINIFLHIIVLYNSVLTIKYLSSNHRAPDSYLSFWTVATRVNNLAIC